MHHFLMLYRKRKMSASNQLKITFHHMGIPVSGKLPDGVYNQDLKLHATGYFESPYAVEWMVFDEDNDLPEIIKQQPHIAYVVDDLNAAIKGRKIILEPNSPCDGVMVAFIKDGLNLVEFLQFDKPEQDVWPHPNKFLLQCK